MTRKTSFTLLIIDTATAESNIVLSQSAQYWFRRLPAGKAQSTQILATIDTLFAEAALILSDVDAIAVTIGPGAFTGLRLGASVAQALAFALKKPLIPLDSLAIYAMQAKRCYGLNEVLVANDARMQAVYWGHYYQNDAGMQLRAPVEQAAVTAFCQQDKTLACIGTAVSAYPEIAEHFSSIFSCVSSELDLLNLAKMGWLSQKSIAPECLALAYVRHPV